MTVPKPAQPTKRRWRLGIVAQMMLLVGTLLIVLQWVQGAYLSFRQGEIISEQIGLRALGVARTVAVIPELIAAFDSEDPSALIQPIAERIRLETGAEYVVVGNDESIRYAHPLPERLGLTMVGGDNDRALIDGESYVSEATGSLGEAIRGKAPIFNQNGDIIGIVSVGFMMEDVEVDVGRYLQYSWQMIGGIALLGLGMAFLIARHFKRVILGMEPDEIARLVKEKEAILQSIHEGIVAVNERGQVTLINQAARRMLSLGDGREILNQPVTDLIPDSKLSDVMTTGTQQFDQEAWVGDQPVVVNRVPILSAHGLAGAVATFRNQAEIMELSRALNEASADVEALRAQAHEFSNRLYTISGLLQLGQHDQALALIEQESQIAQDQVAFLLAHLSDPIVSGMLLGKIMRAEQRGIELTMSADCSLHLPLSPAGQQALMTIVSNLLDNAFDAVCEREQGKRHVQLFFTDLGEQLVFEVEDNGRGINAEISHHVLLEGFSTKPGRHRGIGLAQVNRLCERLGGAVSFEDSELGGACVVASVNKSDVAQAMEMSE